MNNSPQFYKNIWGDLQGNMNSNVWPAVTAAWQDKRYLESFYYLLDYVNPLVRAMFANTEQTEFNVPHGSVLVHISIKDQMIEINCPLVDITDATRIPLLRKVAELNFHPLTVSQIKLSGNQLVFHFKCAVDTAEPYKMYYIMKEICQTADRYDDEFREKFKAKNILEPKIVQLSEEQKEQAWRQTNEIINENAQYLAYFDSQRWYGSSVDFLVIALKRIDLCTQIKGYLRTELDRVLAELTNNNVTAAERIQLGKNFLHHIQEAGKDSFVKNIYQAEVFIPEKWRTSAEQAKTNTEATLNQVQKYHNDKNYIGAAIEALYSIYDLFYKNNMDNIVNAILFDALANAAGKSWEETSGILLNGLRSISTIHSTPTTV